MLQNIKNCIYPPPFTSAYLRKKSKGTPDRCEKFKDRLSTWLVQET